jgi:DNA-binding MarR family transcriptional regulator
LYIGSHREERCRVGHIAREFGLTPATVSDSAAALETKGLLRRQAWEGDARVATLQLTEASAAMTRELENWASRLLESVSELPAREREQGLLFLMRLIELLQQRRVISVARMCITCRFFRPNWHAEELAPHHCALLDKPLRVADLRVDCPEHEPVPA